MRTMKARRVGDRIWEVRSRSRPKIVHTVDLEEISCSCEHHVYRHATCDHMRAAEAGEEKTRGGRNV